MARHERDEQIRRAMRAMIPPSNSRSSSWCSFVSAPHCAHG
jgi:hypothetical protein